MHGAQMLFDARTTWNAHVWEVDEVITKLLREERIRPIAVVAIDNGDELRMAKHFPQAAIDFC